MTYYGESPAQCMAMFYLYPNDETPFFSSCGCGCDSRTDSNACHAHGAGQSVFVDRECGCLETGCDEGEYCSDCWGSFQCIPDGAVC